METIYLLLPIIGAFVFLFLGCCFGRKMKEMLHIPKEVILGRNVIQQLPGINIQEESESEDECPTIRIKFRDSRGRQFTGLIPSDAGSSGLLLSASNQSLDTNPQDFQSSAESLNPHPRSPSRTYTFESIDSDDESTVTIDTAVPVSRHPSGNNRTVASGPLSWDHVVIIESANDTTPVAPPSVAMVTDKHNQHSLHSVDDAELSIHENPVFCRSHEDIGRNSLQEKTECKRDVSVSLGALDSKTLQLVAHERAFDSLQAEVNTHKVSHSTESSLDNEALLATNKVSGSIESSHDAFDDESSVPQQVAVDTVESASCSKRLCHNLSKDSIKTLSGATDSPVPCDQNSVVFPLLDGVQGLANRIGSDIT